MFVNSGMDGSPLITAVKTREGFDLLLPIYEAVKAEIETRGIRVLIIDPFVSSHTVDENANMEIDQVVKAWSRVAKDTGCCILLSHHTNKAGSQEVSAMSARGASALTAAARSVLVLSQMTTSEANGLGIPEGERKRFVKVRDDKHNRAPVGKEDWFELRSVCLGNGAEGRPSDNVGVMVPWMLPEPRSQELTNEQVRQIQELAKNGNYRHNRQASDWFGIALADVLAVGSREPHERRYLEKIIAQLVDDGFLAIEHRPNGRKSTSPYVIAGKASVNGLNSATSGSGG